MKVHWSNAQPVDARDCELKCIGRFAAGHAPLVRGWIPICARLLESFSPVRYLRPNYIMYLWRKRATSPPVARLKHNFMIGPQHHSDLFGRPARLYDCIRCKWSFLVCARTVVVLDEHEMPMAGEESLRRFHTFVEGPCPVLEAFVSAAPVQAGAGSPPSRSEGDAPPNPALRRILAWSARYRRLPNTLTRAHERFGK
jgi:hypothetical protein